MSGLSDRFCLVLRWPQATTTGQDYRRHRTHASTCQHWLGQAFCSLAVDFLTHIQLISTKTDLQIMRPALERESPRGCPPRGSPARSRGTVSAESSPLIALPLRQLEGTTKGWEEELRAPAGGGGWASQHQVGGQEFGVPSLVWRKELVLSLVGRPRVPVLHLPVPPVGGSR